jgi:DNA-binding MarR family transcriptional regulator
VSASQTLLDQLLLVTDLLQKDMARAFDGTALTPARVHLLWVLRHQGPSTQQSLATALDVTPRNITGLVDALEATGFVARGEHPTDRRATLVRLSPAGERAMADMAEDHSELADRLVAGLAPDEVDRLVAGLAQVIDRLTVIVGAPAGAGAAS